MTIFPAGVVYPSFPGSAWERTTGEAPPPAPGSAFEGMQAEPAGIAFPGGAWERGECRPCLRTTKHRQTSRLISNPRGQPWVCHCLEQAVRRPTRHRERRCLSHGHNKAPAVLTKSVALLGGRSSPVCESRPNRHGLFQVAHPRLSGRQGALERKPSGNSMRAITPAGLSGWCTSLGGETDVPPHRGRPRPARDLLI